MHYVLCLFVLSFLPLTPSLQSAQSGLPVVVGPLKLLKSFEGKEAKSFLDSMHDKKVAPKSSSVGEYRSGNQQATLYVSNYETRSQAVSVWKKMAARISGGNRVFEHFQELIIGSITIGRCVGLGQVHFFFCLRNRIYWWAVDPTMSTESLHNLIDSLKAHRD